MILVATEPHKRFLILYIFHQVSCIYVCQYTSIMSR